MEDNKKPIDLENLPPEVMEFIKDLRAEVKKSRTELKELQAAQETKALEQRNHSVRTMSRDDYKKAKKEFLAEQHREYLIRREQVLAESMGKPVVLPEGADNKQPVNVRALDKK